MQIGKHTLQYKTLVRISFICAIPVLAYCIYNLSWANWDFGLLLLIPATILSGFFLQIRMPRTSLYLSLNDAAIFYAFLVYGLEVAVLLSTIETILSIINLQKKGIEFERETILLNISTTVLAVFISNFCVFHLFRDEIANKNYANIQTFGAILLLLAVLQFLITSLFVTVFSALKEKRTLWSVWFDNCVNSIILYAVCAFVAGIMVIAVQQFNPVLVLSTVSILLLAYFTYKRYVDDVIETAAKVEKSERDRAEQAEKHVAELQHYISELESSSRALRDSEKRLRHTAFHDSLTELSNRNNFLEKLQFLVEKSKFKNDLKFAVLHINLNRFKTVNDSLGHSTGNKLLQNVAKRLINLSNPTDLVARIGSDEFAIILSDLQNLDHAIHYAKIVSRKISEPYTLDNRQIFISASIGIALNAQHYDSADNLLRDANIAMYHAKESDNSYAIFDQNMHIQAVSRLQLETDLRYAIERNELQVYYQPILDLNSIQLIGFEALMRWQHPQRGFISPTEFIPVSETTGLIVPMSLWILRESCSKIVEWNNRYQTDRKLLISVNLSGKHFAHPDLVEQIQKIINETGIDVGCLKLEITESAVMENAESAIRMLNRFRQLGIQLSIDDFGTGYSSLSYLHRFPINTLKIDRSFVRTMEAGSENGEIVRTIIALAKSLNLSVIAEGIESIHQIHQLRVLGCEFGQGYLFSRPVPEDEAERLLTDSHRWQSILPQHRSGIVQHKKDFPVLELDEVLPGAHDTIQ